MHTLEVRASNVGGIDDLRLAFTEETVVVSGRNASNKTSLLNSIAFGLGVPDVPIRSGADEARVTLTVGSRTVERVARRTRNGISVDGDGLVDADDSVLVERFAALLETNALRIAVGRGDDVEALLKEPMDIPALERKQASLLEERREFEAELESLSGIDDRLADKTHELEATRQRIAELESQLETLYDEQESIESADDELRTLRERRADLRSKKERYDAQLSELTDAVARLEDERDELAERKRDTADELQAHDADSLREQRARIRDEVDDLEARIEVLQSVLTANREMVQSELSSVLGGASGLLEDEMTCWACGQTASAEAFEETIDRLAELVAEEKARKRERTPEIEQLTERIEDAERAGRRLESLETRHREVEDRIRSRRESIEQKRRQRSEIRAALNDVDAEIERIEAEQTETRSTLADDIEETRVELSTLRHEADQLEERCTDLRAKQSERDRARERIEALTRDIRELTERIENLEQELRETFNETMDDLIDHLEFDRIERVWLDGEFDLVVAREIDGIVRQDGLEHLAESEREMIGLVLGLAGFVAYDVADVTPVLLLDSLGAFDTERTERLITYFSDRTEVLVATAHPEMAAEFDLDTVEFEPKVPS